MVKVNKKEPIIEEVNLLSDRRAEVIVEITRYLGQHKEIRKAYLRKIVGGQHKTFEACLKFLIDLSLIKVYSKYPPQRKDKQGKGRKLKYVKWKYGESKEVVESIESLLAYKDFDLEKFPVRNLDKYDDLHVNLLKKYLFRIERKATKVTASKITKVFNLLNVELGCPINTMRTIYRMTTPVIFGCVQKLMEQGKAEIGINLKTSRVELFKNPDWVFAHTRWKCGNCGFWNVGSNVNYCGKCGDSRND
jgi:hypothetical protein